MALIQCPECGKEISDQAPACIHCGYPLSPTSVPEEPICSVVLLDAAPGPTDTLDILQTQLGMSYAEATAAVDGTPTLLGKNLTKSEACAIEGLFTKYGRVKIFYDKDTGTQEEMSRADPIPAPPETVEPRQPLSFGGVVIAVILGVIGAIVLLSFL